MLPAKDTASLSGAELNTLVAAIATDRDRDAFARVYKYFAPKVKGFLIKAGAPANTAEELAQETMLAVWNKASYFDPARASAATWIFTIARNLRIDHLRRGRAAASAVLDVPEEADQTLSVEAAMLVNEREDRVRAALRSLSEEQATIVRLSFFSDKAHAEIARELSLPLGTVKSRVRLALNKLRTMLDGDL